jgi:hypothetical protein
MCAGSDDEATAGRSTESQQHQLGKQKRKQRASG